MDIHQDQINNYGGSEAIRDIDLLKSSAAMPQASYGGTFLHTDIFEIAAAYMFHIVQNHPFIDGNKRVGAATSIIFLYLNGYALDASEDYLYNLVMQVAQGQVTKSEIALFLKEYSTVLHQR